MIEFVASGSQESRAHFAFTMGRLAGVRLLEVGFEEGDWYEAEEKDLPAILKEAKNCNVTLLRELEG